ncbi:MAG: hypothetical protein IPJ76_07630 [Flavobacteriales bacterium]|nr:MAG: hypothetical protein IPJ76_07630 [Flavobacteriales bacterium]
MKERHPIDDLFRKGLYDSEATPPADVWQRVVAQRSWGHRLLVGLQRRWAMGLVGAALLLTPLAWYAASAEHGADVAQERTVTKGSAGVSGSDASLNASAEVAALTAAEPVQANVAHETPVLVPNEGSASTASMPKATVGTTEKTKGGNESSRSATERRTANAENRSSAPERGTALGTASTATLSAGAQSASANDERKVPDEAASQNEGTANSATGTDALVANHTAEDDYVTGDMVMLRTRLSDMDRELDSMKTAAKPLETPYVLPHGTWWMGVQLGWNEWNGGWSGEGRLAEDMNASETWQNGWQVGLVGGRTWRSGLSISAGLEYARLKSRFLYTGSGTNSSDSINTMVLDTTWSVNAVAPDSSYVVYTYDIAYVPVESIGENVRYNATNRYALLSVPVEVAYQWNFGRFTLAPRAGAAFNWFIGRDGRTLVASTNDGSPRPVGLSDAGAADRFGLWITGSAGVDVGYAVDERTQVFLGGGYSSLLLGGGDLHPTLGGAQLRLRLVREFGMKQRKAKLP